MFVLQVALNIPKNFNATNLKGQSTIQHLNTRAG